ncbi:MAG: hypothetical protein E3J56_13170 [Candidatus Aminicenantes bacterium]|nr:MAG: hypothetical protein E3J56_13170 [Candidatus Aminicenantes bacterium]
MNERQFELLMAKLEEIRGCIIDVEEESKKSSQQADAADSKELDALPRWRCKSCRRLYKEYEDAVNCCC